MERDVAFGQQQIFILRALKSHPAICQEHTPGSAENVTLSRVDATTSASMRGRHYRCAFTLRICASTASGREICRWGLGSERERRVRRLGVVWRLGDYPGAPFPGEDMEIRSIAAIWQAGGFLGFVWRAAEKVWLRITANGGKLTSAASS